MLSKLIDKIKRIKYSRLTKQEKLYIGLMDGLILKYENRVNAETYLFYIKEGFYKGQFFCDTTHYIQKDIPKSPNDYIDSIDLTDNTGVNNILNYIINENRKHSFCER